ncbi:MAG: hypothetical protein A2020_07470 [Lentisphaerae bacterium GWF2_45_14]|nr:MAG: hypothetical protein A2020_07470 [Lentisphaerae bacterium GWF2_45_14]
MNILLIDPSIGTGDGLNTGLAWLAASVDAAGYGVRVLDFVNRPQMDFDSTALYLKENVERLKPDVVGFCIHSITTQITCRLVENLKKHYDGFVIIGGPQMAFEHGEIFNKMPQIDFAVVGEAEDTLPELLAALENKASEYSEINGIIWKKSGKIIENTSRKQRQDIDTLPYPDYRKHFGLETLTAPYSIMTSRGCPYSCIFCNSHMSGKKWRTRSLENVMNELENAIRIYGVQEFMVQEPVFNLRPERVVEFCHLLQERKINLPWFSPSGIRADKLTPECIEAMKESGCTEIKIGVESLVPEVLENANKNVTVETIVEICNMIKKSSFPLRGSFIIGLPGDNYQRTMENFNRSRKLGFDTTDWSLLIPYPGTKAYEWVMENGRMFYDYCSADQGAFQVTKPGDIKLAFDTVDFPAKERIKAFVKISVKSGNYIFDRNQSSLKKAYSLLKQIMLHDPLRILTHISGIYKKLKISRKRGPLKSDRYKFKELAPFAKTIQIEKPTG